MERELPQFRIEFMLVIEFIIEGGIELGTGGPGLFRFEDKVLGRLPAEAAGNGRFE